MGEVRYMISEASKRVNVETHVLRHWEEELGLKIGRTEMGHRYYTEEDVRLFNCIKELKEQGMLLKELKDLIPDMLKAKAKANERKMNKEKEEQKHMSELQMALLENNQILQEAIIREMGYLFQAQDLQEEERYKKLDYLIRQQQSYRKEYARSTPLRQLRKIFEG
ncbi:MAG: MerR family transcriptional regulator [Tyzzerella sp.]|nr:MerR family transcriptional regulator [Tyzzerella sp.]